MMNRLLILLLSLTTLTAYSSDPDKDYSDAFKLIEIWLEAQKDYENLPGLTAAIVDDQEILWTHAVGKANREGRTKAEPATLFSICSISKLFTSVAIMQLYDEGLIRLDDNLDDILPEYSLQQQFPESGPITIRSLLSHASGLPRENTFPHWNGPNYETPSAEIIMKELKNLETLYPASTYFQYSNLAMTILGQVVEKISGVNYEEYIDKNILKPLDLSYTQPFMPRDMHGKELAIGYSTLQRDGSIYPLNFFEAKGVASAAGFSSNVIDLAKFASWQFRLADSKDTEVLKPSTLNYMHNVHWTDPDWETTWGLGFAVYKGNDNKKWVGHGGHCPGYQTTFRMEPKSKRAYTVMINSSGGYPSKYARGMHEILSKVDASVQDSIAKKRKDLSEYTGFYDFDGLEETTISTWEGKLILLSLPTNYPGDFSSYKLIEEDTFQRIRKDGELAELLIFERNNERQIIAYSTHNYRYKKISD